MHTELEPKLEGRRTAPSHTTRNYGLLGLVLVLVLCALFAAGYLPRRKAEAGLIADVRLAASESRRVTVALVRRAAINAETVLPGNIQPIEDTPIYARADGYIRRRHADIGDRVQAGQLLAEIETPELDQQIRQARGALEQTRAAALRVRAALGQSRTKLALAGVTLNRWAALVGKGVVSKQDGDQKQAEYDAAEADVRAAEAAVKAADSDVSASEANVQRLLELAAFRKVTAPFPGVITARNIDTGTLITAGSNASTKPLYNLAQTGRLRIYINVPQPFAPSVHVGEQADVLVQEFPGEAFRGTVTRTANSLDEKSHTLLTEVQVPNSQRRLLPGMYAQVRFVASRAEPPLVVPSDALMVRSTGPFVLDAGDGTVHYRKVKLGRDYGTQVEITSGLVPGEKVIVNPTDDLKEGEKVAVTDARE